MVKVIDEGIYRVPREKVWKLIEAHATDLTNIHPSIKSSKHLRKEDDSDVIEEQVDMEGRIVKVVLKVTARPPDRLILEFLEGPMTGKMVNTYADVPGGTKVTTEADMKSAFMNDQQLEAAVHQQLNSNFEEDTLYLSKMERRPPLNHTIVHFEIPANDPQKLESFYTNLFGWKFEGIPEMEYWLIATKAKEEDMGINGGMMKKRDPNHCPVNYVLVESVDEFSRKIQQLGGKIVVPKQEVPGRGFLAVALDPEGNLFGLWQSSERE